MKFLISPEYTSILKAHIHVALDKKQKSDKVDKLYKKAQKLMHEFSLLCDGDTEACTEEADCLMEYMGKMTQLQLKRMGRKTEAAHMQECNDAFAQDQTCSSQGWSLLTFMSQSLDIHVSGTLA